MKFKYVSIQGTCGSGKGTRTLQFIQYLKYKGLNYKRVYLKVNSEKTLFLGILFEDINALFIGKLNKYRKIKNMISWVSADYICSNLVKNYFFTETLSVKGNQILESLIKNTPYCIIADGYPGVLPYPHKIAEEINFKQIITFGYIYYKETILKDLKERCFNRSGNDKTKGISATKAEYRSRDAVKRSIKSGILTYDLKFDAPITIFGEVLLRECGITINNCSRIDFLNWSKENLYFRDIRTYDDDDNRVKNLNDFYLDLNREQTQEDIEIKLQDIIKPKDKIIVYKDSKKHIGLLEQFI